MKKQLYCFIFAMSSLFAYSQTKIIFPDKNLQKKIKAELEKQKIFNCFDKDGNLDPLCPLITHIAEKAVSGVYEEPNFTPLTFLYIKGQDSISNLSGIEKLKSIQTIWIKASQINKIELLPPNLLELKIQNIDSIQVKSLPDNLERLTVNSVNVITLPTLPKKLKSIIIEFTKAEMESMVHLSELNDLTLRYMSLTSLPSLPTKLSYLNCSQNQITKLVKLPLSLKELDATNNSITFIDKIPDNMKVLNLFGNKLNSLPSLPLSCNELIVSGNKEIKLDKLPSRLEKLRINYCAIKQLPELPATLKELDCHDNEMYELPSFVSQLETLSFDKDKIKCIKGILPKQAKGYSSVCTWGDRIEIPNCR
jgi:hypothetical protein